MKILITGGTGFVGGRVVEILLQSGHQVVCVGRSRFSQTKPPGFDYVSGDTTMPGDWQKVLKEAGAVINLAGATISKRWSDRWKKQIYDSRILTTRNIVEGLPQDTRAVLVSASATGYYGDRDEEILMENAPPGNGFLSKVAFDWEQEALLAEKKGARVALTRFGVVLGKGGGAMEKLIPVFKCFFGGPLGSGKQWFPWIHRDDLALAMKLVVENPDISGPVNFTSPIPIRQKGFAKALGRGLGRPAILPAPAFMLRMILGEFADSLLQSQKVVPDQLIKHGYKFRFMEVETALEDIIGQVS